MNVQQCQCACHPRRADWPRPRGSCRDVRIKRQRLELASFLVRVVRFRRTAERECDKAPASQLQREIAHCPLAKADARGGVVEDNDHCRERALAIGDKQIGIFGHTTGCNLQTDVLPCVILNVLLVDDFDFRLGEALRPWAH